MMTYGLTLQPEVEPTQVEIRSKPMAYSYLSATIGSTFVARRAGR